MEDLKYVRFSCKGNICRSPAAEIILSHKSAQHICISTASTPNTRGRTIHPQMVLALKKRGYTVPNPQRFATYEGDILIDILDYFELHDLHAEGIQDPYLTGDFHGCIDELEEYIDTIILDKES